MAWASTARALNEFTRAELDQRLADGATIRPAVRCFQQWARGRGLIGELTVLLLQRQ